MPHSICVFCSSSDAVARPFFDAAAELGRAIAARGDTLVYGGTNCGLMGALAAAAHDAGGRIIGVIPRAMKEMNIACDIADELLVTPDMRQRKAMMESRSDAFVALPGGLGTLEELFEIITLKHLRYHAKPVVLLNTRGFYDPLSSLLEHLYRHKFAKPACRGLYHVAGDAAEVFAYLDAYHPEDPGSKWGETK